ncbi:MAG: anaerobic ribonucleoside-triphosphate reductase [Planctomycetia bacterium]|nr:anaerobic ribonucleoside-triphosphate reductase [Planctomycetia bacterium]
MTLCSTESENRLMQIYEDITFRDSKSSSLKRENANINGDTSMGAMLQMGSAGAREYFLERVLKPEHAVAHKAGDIHIHDLDFYTTTTCTQIDLIKLFKDGFSTGHGILREPNDIQSYAALACIAIQSNQNDQHGGQSIVNFDYGLAPGVAKTFRKRYRENMVKALGLRDVFPGKTYLNLDELSVQVEKTLAAKGLYIRYLEGSDQTQNKDYLDKEFDAYGFDRDDLWKRLDGFGRWINQKECNQIEAFLTCQQWAYAEAVFETERATYQAMEGLVHNLNTMHSRAGAQVPFSSINYGMDTSPEGRLVTRSVLLAHEAGLGGGETPIFPIHCFRVCDGVNGTEGDPNYDLFKLACRVSAKRLFPNFVFQDAPYNKAFYKGTSETECASMGCVGGNETIKYKIGKTFYHERFQDAWNRLALTHLIKTQGLSHFMDVENVFVYDSQTGGFVNVRRFIKNPDMGNWKEVVFTNGHSLQATADHPLPVLKQGRTAVQDLTTGDYIPTARTALGLWPQEMYCEVAEVNDLGTLNQDSYDVETESDYFDVSGVISHNCRTRVIANVYDPTQEISWSRGNLSFTSINLPRLAIQAKGDKNRFFADLEQMVKLCIDQLLDRLEYQSRRKKKNFPFLMNGVWLDSEKLGPEDEVREVIKHGTLSVGFIGLAETLIALTGKHHGESSESQNLGLEIVSFMRQLLDEEAQKRKLNFSLLATPAESLAGRFIELDKQKFGVLPGITDRKYYTNSFHVPVWFPISIADKIKTEAPYHELCNAGHITYVELDGDTTQNVEAFEKIVQLMKVSGIGYGAINHPIDHDPVCGYNGIINDTCPKCGRKETNDKPFERIRRITGYLVGSLDRFNDAKRAEVEDRVTHKQ